MIKKGLVSILTPAYNAGNYIYRLLDSVLEQTYPFVSMIVIDDGSTDNTEQVVKSYIPKFKERGYNLAIFYQENSGQSTAINNGLKYVDGEYFVWPDSDDWYASNTALSRLVEILEANDNITVVRCQLNHFSEKDLQPFSVFCKYEQDAVEDLFEDCLFCKNGFWFQPGGYMIRMKDLDRLIPNRNIYVSKRAGQNWQLMLPLLYKSSCYTFKDKLYNVLVRPTSHSHIFLEHYEKRMEMSSVYEDTIVATLNSMQNISDECRNMYIRQIHLKYLKQNFYLSVEKNQRKDIDKFVADLEKIGKLTVLSRIEAQYPIVYRYRIFCKHYYWNLLRLWQNIRKHVFRNV